MVSDGGAGHGLALCLPLGQLHVQSDLYVKGHVS